jgi:hypothetical protein
VDALEDRIRVAEGIAVWRLLPCFGCAFSRSLHWFIYRAAFVCTHRKDTVSSVLKSRLNVIFALIRWTGSFIALLSFFHLVFAMYDELWTPPV